jgi:hypothetical protein
MITAECGAVQRAASDKLDSPLPGREYIEFRHVLIAGRSHIRDGFFRRADRSCTEAHSRRQFGRTFSSLLAALRTSPLGAPSFESIRRWSIETTT